MKNLKDNQMVITDESGVEHLCEILFTYENEERKVSYVVFYELDNPDEVMAMRYNEDKTLEDIEDDEEFEEVLEVFEAFNEENENEEEIEEDEEEEVEPESSEKDLKGYPHFMLKEIEEIDTVINRLVDLYAKDGHYRFDPKLIEDLKNADDIVFVACGTSYHASLVGARYFESIGKCAQVHIASEFGYYPKLKGEKTVYIMLSQSGETADSLRCLRLLKEQNKKLLVVTNTKDSTMDKDATYCILLKAGPEISVASTKVFSAMVASLALLVGALSNDSNTIKDLQEVARKIQTIKARKEELKTVALKIKGASDLFYLGRGYDYITALESSLKLKETSYVHSEAFPGGEIRHGPIALVTEETPVVIFISDAISAEAMRSVAKEIEGRGAKVYIISNESLKKNKDAIVIDDAPVYLSPLMKSVVAFYLAYFVSSAKGLDVDKPRSLSKAVTAE